MTVQPAATTPRRPRLRRGKWESWHGLVALAVVALFISLGIWAAASKSLVTSSAHLACWTFVALAALLTTFVVVVGWGITGRVGGALIDPKKGRMSLSRLQVMLWTILVLSAYFNAFAVNVAAGKDNPLTVAIPGELLIAMGISISSLIGTGIVLTYKAAQAPVAPPPDVQAEFDARGVATAPEGRVLYANDAWWRDIFQGDTTETGAYLDLGKIQMFYITIALVLGYGIAVGSMFSGVTTQGVTSLPDLDQAFVALLAISHAGYLTTKATS